MWDLLFPTDGRWSRHAAAVQRQRNMLLSECVEASASSPHGSCLQAAPEGESHRREQKVLAQGRWQQPHLAPSHRQRLPQVSQKVSAWIDGWKKANWLRSLFTWRGRKNEPGAVGTTLEYEVEKGLRYWDKMHYRKKWHIQGKNKSVITSHILSPSKNTRRSHCQVLSLPSSRTFSPDALRLPHVPESVTVCHVSHRLDERNGARSTRHTQIYS